MTTYDEWKSTEPEDETPSELQDRLAGAELEAYLDRLDEQEDTMVS